jgi:small subunit ribosomal protein S20
VAHSLSAKKRVRQNIRKKKINRARKSQIKTQIKRFEKALAEGNVETAGEEYRLIVKRLDKAAGAGTMHKNAVARKKSRLAKKLNLKTKKA